MGERFSVEPYWKTSDRYDHRNVEGKVRDGFLVTDTLTRDSRRVARKRDAAQVIERVLAREAELDWTRIACFEATEIRYGGACAEVYGLDAQGNHVAMLCLIGGNHRDTLETIGSQVRVWLTALGHGDLTARVSSSRA